jgi:hypothetical protein
VGSEADGQQWADNLTQRGYQDFLSLPSSGRFLILGVGAVLADPAGDPPPTAAVRCVGAVFEVTMVGKTSVSGVHHPEHPFIAPLADLAGSTALPRSSMAARMPPNIGCSDAHWLPMFLGSRPIHVCRDIR